MLHIFQISITFCPVLSENLEEYASKDQTLFAEVANAKAMLEKLDLEKD